MRRRNTFDYGHPMEQYEMLMEYPPSHFQVTANDPYKKEVMPYRQPYPPELPASFGLRSYAGEGAPLMPAMSPEEGTMGIYAQQFHAHPRAFSVATPFTKFSANIKVWRKPREYTQASWAYHQDSPEFGDVYMLLNRIKSYAEDAKSTQMKFYLRLDFTFDDHIRSGMIWERVHKLVNSPILVSAMADVHTLISIQYEARGSHLGRKLSEHEYCDVMSGAHKIVALCFQAVGKENKRCVVDAVSRDCSTEAYHNTCRMMMSNKADWNCYQSSTNDTRRSSSS